MRLICLRCIYLEILDFVFVTKVHQNRPTDIKLTAMNSIIIYMYMLQIEYLFDLCMT